MCNWYSWVLAIPLLLLGTPLRVTGDPANTPCQKPAAVASVPACSQEWWYLFGRVRTQAGNDMGFSFAFSRYSRSSRYGTATFHTTPVYVATATLVDISSHRMLYQQRRERGAIGLANADPIRLDDFIDDWDLVEQDRVAGGNVSTIMYSARYGPVDLDLSLDSPARSVSISKAGNAGNLLSGALIIPRLTVHGAVELDGQRSRVTGHAMLLHEFGDPVCGKGLIGWTRFEIMFDDGRTLLVTLPRVSRARRCPAAGIFVSSTGHIRYLHPETIQVENPLRTTFTSIRTGLAYPSLWELRIAPEDLDLALVPPVQDQEIATGITSIYEGALDVERAPPPSGDFGVGNVEQAGLFAPVELFDETARE